MAINDKPFTRALKITRRIFGFAPKVFSSYDLNQMIDSQYDNVLQLSTNLGMLRENWNVNRKLDEDSIVGNNNVFKSEISIKKVVDANPAYVYARGIRFEIPTGDQRVYVLNNATTAKPDFPIGYLILVATKKTVTFNQNPELCGLTSDDEFPQSVPSSDAEQYSDERLVYTTNPFAVALAVGEEQIGIIATVTVQDEGYLNKPTIDEGTDPTTVGYNFQPWKSRVVRYNAALLDEILATFRFEWNDSLLSGLGYNNVPNQQIQRHNNSVIDILLMIQEYMKRKMRYFNLIKLHYSDKIDRANTRIDEIVSVLGSLGDAVNGLGGLTQVPIGAMLPYNGSLSLFETETGVGKAGTAMANFRLCNGQGGTLNPAGCFLVGAIAGVPGLSASTLPDNVNPSYDKFPAGMNPNYSLGARGGWAGHQLTNAELPKTKLKIETSVNQSGGGKAAVGNGGSEGELYAQEFGLDKPHNNLPPYLAVYWIQRYK